MSSEAIQCPTCWESFEVTTPPDSERPTEMDYDCEICCRPMLIICPVGGESFARSLGE